MVNIILASSLSRFTEKNNKNFQYDNLGTLNDILSTLCKENRELSKFIYKNPHELHPFVNIFIDNINIRDQQGLNTKVEPHSTIRILPGIAGG